MKKTKTLWLISSVIGMTWLLGFYVIAFVQPPAQAQGNLPDVATEALVVSNSYPTVGETITFTVQIKNVGTENVAGPRAYLYIDPPDDPPTPNTAPTRELIVAGIAWPPGDSMVGELGNYAFDTPGEHVIYAWVDPLERLDESNEQNNLKVIRIQVSTPANGTVTDVFEPDNNCPAAKEIATDGTIQTRRFISQAPKDIDWVKFQVVANQVYTITATGMGNQAHPELELWADCQTPPNSFGTNAVLIHTARESGFNYLRIGNEPNQFEAAQTGYNLRIVGAQGSSQASVVRTPAISSLTPNSASNDVATDVKILGSNFNIQSVVELCLVGNNQCSADCTPVATQLAPLNQDSNQNGDRRLDATIQPNLRPGNYCLQVTNPANNQTGILPNGFIVTAGTPTISRVQPQQGFNNAPIELDIYGTRLFAISGVTLQVGNITLLNPDQIQPDGSHIKATVPTGLPAGQYDITIRYPNGQTMTLPQAYRTVEFNADSNDLYADDTSLVIDPPTPQLGSPVSLYLRVKRKGGGQTLANLPVQFTVNGVDIGTVTVPSLITEGESLTLKATWTPQTAGPAQITALIDPNNQISEADENNNQFSTSVDVLQGTDQVAPRVATFTIDQGRQVTTDTEVYLSVSVADNQPDSEPIELKLVEFEYNMGIGLFVPVFSTDWVISNTQFIAHYLSNKGGVHYIQAWARDAAGNISQYPYQQEIEYQPPSEQVARDGARVYRRTLNVGQSLAVRVTTLTGDADLYIWPPDHQEGRPPWVSNLTGLAEEYLCLQTPVDGVHQIEIYGYNDSNFQISIDQPAQCNRMGRQNNVDPNKSLLQNPVVDPSIRPTTAEIPILQLTPTNLSFTDSPPAPQTLTIRNSSSTGILYWSVGKTAPWLKLNNQDSTSGIGDASLSVSVDPTQCDQETCTDLITINAPGAATSRQTIPVTFEGVATELIPVYLPLVVK